MSESTRRSALKAAVGTAGLAATTLVLAACGGDTTERYDTGFVEGSGVSTEIDADERGAALDVTGTTYGGEEFSLASHRGSVVVLNVWYAACAPCRKEAPDLKAIAEDYETDGVSFIGVNVRDAAGPAAAFEETYAIPYPSIPDPEGTILYALRGQVAPNAVPSTLVFDRESRVAARISGVADPSILRAMIDRVLSE
ncbi:MAG: TlpA disulfide reductase family protein [Dermabacter sp.]|nr:TlpA disulfide reductase family protein [Dermabacter sp.]